MTRIYEFNGVLYPIRFESVKAMFNFQYDFPEKTQIMARCRVVT
jgi:hypothetical protein